jgi:hypothetical protein
MPFYFNHSSYIVPAAVLRGFLCLCLVTLGTLLQAQTATIKGSIIDLDNQPALGVLVKEKGNPTNGQGVDAFGRFSINVPSGVDVVLLFEGFSKNVVERPFRLSPGEVREITVVIDNSVETGTVIIRGAGKTGLRPIETKLKTSLPTINPGIESFLIQAPVNFASELSSSYSVRGGSFDENLIYVNDIQVYRPFLVRAGEQEGLSFPNPDMVDNIKFSAGGFEAKYGDRLSSVLDIRYHRPDSFAGRVSMGLLGASLQMEGTTKSHQWTHNTGFRYKNNSYIFNSLDVQGDYRPLYYDLQSYITYRPEEYGRWEFSFLGNYARNKYTFIPSTRQTDVGNINEALRLTVFFDGQETTQFETYFGAISTRFNPEPTAQLRFTLSAFNTYETEFFDIQGAYRLDELERDLGSDEFGEVLRNRGVGGFIDHGRNILNATVLNFSHKGFVDYEHQDRVLSWGFDVQSEQIFDQLKEWTLIDSAGYAGPHPPDSLGYQDPNAQINQEIYLHDRVKAVNDLQNMRATAYIQHDKEWTLKADANGLSDKLSLNVGARAHYWSFNQQLVGGPRVLMSYTPTWLGTLVNKRGKIDTLTKDIVLRFAAGYYWQPPFYREMRGLDGRVNPDIRAQRSLHFIAGLDYIFHAWHRPFKLTTELYYKKLDNLIPYKVENVRLRYLATNNSKGYAGGADIMVNGEFIPGVQSWLRASVLKTSEDLLDDYYYLYLNSEGDTIIPGFSLNEVATDSIRQVPGYIPRPNDQRFSFSMLFQDEMPKKPWYKVLLTMYFSTGVPFGPPGNNRYLDVSRTRSYIRTDIGFSRDLILPAKKNKNKFNRTFDSGTISLEVFNLLGVNNIINHQWVQDVNGRQYGIPTYLTGRRLNLRLALTF